MDTKNPPPVHSSQIRSIPSTSNVIDPRHKKSRHDTPNHRIYDGTATNPFKRSCPGSSPEEDNVQEIRTDQQTNRKSKTFASKFISKKEFPTGLRSYVKLQKEITRCRPQAKILNAYINSKNQLVIRSETQEDANYISKDWPQNAFTYGIEKIDPNPKFFLALYNVSTDFDTEDQDNKAYMLTKYNITKMLRITQRNTNV